jgi:hypothetical protein
MAAERASPEDSPVPIVSVFYGIVIRMYYDEHNPPHVHAEYQGGKSLLDFRGAVLIGDMGSRTALSLVRKWIALRRDDLIENWELALAGKP